MYCFNALTDDEKKGIFGSIYDGIINGLKSVTNMIFGNNDNDNDDNDRDRNNPYSKGRRYIFNIYTNVNINIL